MLQRMPHLARRANEDVLVDAHCVGGDPGKGNVYGVAAWNLEKATLMLRNSSDKPQTIDIEPVTVFEVPQHHKVEIFTLKSPWADEADQPAVTLPFFRLCGAKSFSAGCRMAGIRCILPNRIFIL